MQALLQRFSQHRSLWGGVVEAMAQVDALASLAAAANDASAHGPVCRPQFVSPEGQDTTAVRVIHHEIVDVCLMNCILPCMMVSS